ncbi:hypothetical protein L7F22_031714 [Adiantum nelumboides]|nr:hypothetical protein [Adiantum nelumboides]
MLSSKMIERAMMVLSMGLVALVAAVALVIPAETIQSGGNGNRSYIEIPIMHRYQVSRLMGREPEDDSWPPAAAFVDELVEDRKTEIITGSRFGSYQYLARLSVGAAAVNPGDLNPREFFMNLDTGGDLIWMQCEPCEICYPQVDQPVFDPGLSKTLNKLHGASSVCQMLLSKRTSDQTSRWCTYKTSYNDGTSTSGTLVQDFTTLAGDAGRVDLTFGCSNRTTGVVGVSAGILALGRGFFSFPSQLGRAGFQPSETVLSYCLPAVLSTDSSTLTFGAPVPPQTVFTPLIHNPIRLKNLYFVQLTGISVDGTLLAGLPPYLFDIDPNTGQGGTLLDTGSTLTYLPDNVVYLKLLKAVKDAIAANAPNLRRADPAGRCFIRRAPDADIYDGVPTLSFHFADDAKLEIPPQQVIVPKSFGLDKLMCMSFNRMSISQIIIGSVHQQHTRITIDTHSERLGFTPNAC